MKPDVLERLLMDRALGRLEADVEALLSDHLARDPAATAQAGELQEVVFMATKAVRPSTHAIELPSQIHRLVWRHRAEQALALAASFVIGIGITALVFRASLRRDANVASRTPANASSPAAVAVRLTPARSQIESLPFWSNQRAYLLASAPEKTFPKAAVN